MVEYFKIISPVIIPKDGSPTVKIELEKTASDWLCKAISLLVQRAAAGGADAEHVADFEELQQQVIKAWEIFRP
jgi:hypothetical protein